MDLLTLEARPCQQDRSRTPAQRMESPDHSGSQALPALERAALKKARKAQRLRERRATPAGKEALRKTRQSDKGIAAVARRKTKRGATPEDRAALKKARKVQRQAIRRRCLFQGRAS